jgi:hypothetical protein
MNRLARHPAGAASAYPIYCIYLCVSPANQPVGEGNGVAPGSFGRFGSGGQYSVSPGWPGAGYCLKTN